LSERGGGTELNEERKARDGGLKKRGGGKIVMRGKGVVIGDLLIPLEEGTKKK